MYDDDNRADSETQVDTNDPSLAFAIEFGFNPRKPLKKSERHIAAGLRVLARLRANGHKLINSPNGAWLFGDGGWRQLDKNWLAMQIELTCVTLGFNSNTKLITETRCGSCVSRSCGGIAGRSSSRRRGHEHARPNPEAAASGGRLRRVGAESHSARQERGRSPGLAELSGLHGPVRCPCFKS